MGMAMLNMGMEIERCGLSLKKVGAYAKISSSFCPR